METYTSTPVERVDSKVEVINERVAKVSSQDALDSNDDIAQAAVVEFSSAYRKQKNVIESVLDYWVLYTDDVLKHIWDGFYYLTAFYYAVEVPLANVYFYRPTWYMLILELIVYIYCVSHIMLSFHVATKFSIFPVRSKPSKKVIVKSYVQTWFFIDLITVIPVDLLLYIIKFFFSSNDSVFYPLMYAYLCTRYFKFLRLLRLPFLFKTQNIIRQAKLDRFSKPMMSFFWIFAINHWLSCIWLYSRSNDRYKYDPVSLYILSFYYISMTITTLGYGDIEPENDTQRVLSIVFMLLGVIIYGYVIGKISLMLMKNDRIGKSQDEIVELASIMKFYNVPDQVHKEVMSFHQYTVQKTIVQNYDDIISILPPTLQHRIHSYGKMKIISGFPVFKYSSVQCKEDFATHFTQVYAHPREVILEYGCPGKEVYFISHGIVIVEDYLGRTLCELNPGDFFGEIAVMYNIKRTATLRAKTYCSLYKLEKEPFVTLMTKYPGLSGRIKKETNQRIKKINQITAQRRVAEFKDPSRRVRVEL